MKSGDKFLHNKSGVVYTLQKLPDFDLWILIGDCGGILTHWIGPTRHYGPIDEAIKAFEGSYEDFTPYKGEEELVTMTYRELFKRACDQTLNVLGINIWYMNEGGDPTAIRDIPKSIAMDFMGEEEFNHRKHDANS